MNWKNPIFVFLLTISLASIAGIIFMATGDPFAFGFMLWFALFSASQLPRDS